MNESEGHITSLTSKLAPSLIGHYSLHITNMILSITCYDYQRNYCACVKFYPIMSENFTLLPILTLI